MAIKYNGNTIKAINFNGETIKELVVNGNVVWKKTSASLYFFDDFNRTSIGTTPVIGPAYNYNSASAISGNKYKPAYGNYGHLTFPGPASGNFTIEADITRTSTSGTVAIFIGVDNPGGAIGSRMAVAFNNNLIKVYDASNSSTNYKSVSKTITNNVAYKLKVEVLERKHIKVYLDGVELFTYSRSYTMDRNIGLYHTYCYQNHFVDNLTVYDLG